MNTRLLKINAMKRFSRWMKMTGYGPHAITPFSTIKEIDDIFAHQKEIDKRNEFCSKRKLGIVSYQRAEHADNYLNYIVKRYERRKHGHK